MCIASSYEYLYLISNDYYIFIMFTEGCLVISCPQIIYYQRYFLNVQHFITNMDYMERGLDENRRLSVTMISDIVSLL